MVFDFGDDLMWKAGYRRQTTPSCVTYREVLTEFPFAAISFVLSARFRQRSTHAALTEFCSSSECKICLWWTDVSCDHDTLEVPEDSLF